MKTTTQRDVIRWWYKLRCSRKGAARISSRPGGRENSPVNSKKGLIRHFNPPHAAHFWGVHKTIIKEAKTQCKCIIRQCGCDRRGNGDNIYEGRRAVEFKTPHLAVSKSRAWHTINPKPLPYWSNWWPTCSIIHGRHQLQSKKRQMKKTSGTSKTFGITESERGFRISTVEESVSKRKKIFRVEMLC